MFNLDSTEQLPVKGGDIIMIKIICKKSEQEAIINIIARSETNCLFDYVEPATKTYPCMECKDCWDCLRNNIKWEVTDG